MRTIKDFNKDTIVTDIKGDLQKKINEGLQKLEETVNVTLEDKIKTIQIVSNGKIKNLSEKLQQQHTGLSEKTQKAVTLYLKLWKKRKYLLLVQLNGLVKLLKI
jgi:hypothetical protein